MNTMIVREESKKRPGLVSFTCGAIWIFLIPALFIAIARMSGLPGFWDAPSVQLGIPLPAGLVPLILFVISAVGLWRMQPWGVWLYGLAGLFNVALMLIQPNAPAALGVADLPNSLEWSILGLVHLGYSWLLWSKLTRAS